MLVAKQLPYANGQNLNLNARIGMGEQKRVAPSNPPHDPLLAAFLSGCCFAGLGQIILGQVKKGLLLLGITILVALGTYGIGAIVMYPIPEG